MTDAKTIQRLNEFVAKVDAAKKREKMDLSSDQDLSLAIMNLVSIEEHFFFTGAKTGKHEYYDMIKDVREMRKELLKKIIKEYEGEVWCISKHLLAASMRLMEVGTKELTVGRKESAYDLFGKAYNLYSLFWGINMKLVSLGEVKKIGQAALNAHDREPRGFLGSLGDMVKKVFDCCIE